MFERALIKILQCGLQRRDRSNPCELPGPGRWRRRRVSWRQRLFLGWLAPRGIVTAAVASLFAIRLEQAGVLGAGRLQGLVFLTILMTVGLQGLTAQPLARVLGLIDSTAKEIDEAVPVEPSEATS